MTDNDPLQAREMLNQALDLRRQQRYAEALEKCEAALRLDPGDPRHRSLRDKLVQLKAAFDLLKQSPDRRASETALQSLEQALARPTLEVEADMAEFLQEEKQLLQQGLAETRAALATRLSGEAINLYRKASARERRAALEESEAKLLRALELDPASRTSIEANLGQIQEELGHLAEADEFVAAGRKALAAGDYEGACRHFEAAIERNGAHPEAGRGLDEARDRLDVKRELDRGDAESLAGGFAKAMEHFRTARSLGSRYSDLRSLADERLQEAQRQLADGEGYDSALARAQEALEGQRFAEAAEQFREALALRPGDPLARAGLGKAEGQEKALQELLAGVEATLAEDAPDLETAQLYADQALTRFDQNPQVQALWVDVLLRSGQQLLDQERYDEAQEEFEEILERFPDHRRAMARHKEAEDRQRVATLKEKGQAAFAGGLFAEAATLLAKALEVGQDYADLRDELQILVTQARQATEAADRLAHFTGQARQAREDEKWDAVITNCEQALRIDEQAQDVQVWRDEAHQKRDQVETLLRAGRDALAGGHFQQAVAALEQARRVWPVYRGVIDSLVQASVDWGDNLLRHERWGEAVGAFDRSLQLAPGHEGARRGRQAAHDLPEIRRLAAEGQEALAGGRPEAALQSLRLAEQKAQGYDDELASLAPLVEQAKAAVEAEKRFAEAHNQAAAAHRHGRLEEVIRWLDQALAQKPGDAETADLREQAKRDQKAFERALQQGQDLLTQAHQAFAQGQDDEAQATLSEAMTQFGAARLLAPESELTKEAQAQVMAFDQVLDLVVEAKKRRSEDDLEGATQLLSQAIQQWPDDDRLTRLLHDYVAERDRRRRAQAEHLREQADRLRAGNQLHDARRLYQQVHDLIGDPEAQRQVERINAELERHERIDSLVEQGETQLRQAQFDDAVAGFREAVELLLSEGEVSRQAAALVRQANDPNLVSQLYDENSHEMAWKAICDYRAQAEAFRIEGSLTSQLLDVAERLQEARLRDSLQLQSESARQAEKYQESERYAELLRQRDPRNETLRQAQQAALDKLVRFQEGRVQKRVVRAETALEDGDYTAALVQLREALEIQPVSESVRDDVEMLLRKAEDLEALGASVRPFITQSKALLASGKYEQAIAALEEAQRQDSEGKAAVEARQVQKLLLDARQGKEAVLERQVMERLNAARPLVVSARDPDSLEKAQSELREALALIPKHPEVTELLNSAEEKKGRLRQAAGLKKEAQEHLKAGEYEQVLDLLERAQKLDQADTEVIVLMSEASQRLADARQVRELRHEGQTALGIGEYAQAVKSLGRLHGLDPGDEDVADLLRRARVELALEQVQEHLEAGRYPQAVATSQRALNLEPENPVARRRLQEATDRLQAQQTAERLRQKAAIALQARDFQEAQACIEESLQHEPAQPQSLALKDEIEAAQRAAGQAERFLRATRQAFADMRYDDALEECKKALDLDGGNPEARALKQQVEQTRDRDQLIARAESEIRQALDGHDYERAAAQVIHLQALDPHHRDLDRFSDQIREGQAAAADRKKQLQRARFLLSYGTTEQLEQAITLLEEYVAAAPEGERQEAESLMLGARSRRANEERIATFLAQAKKDGAAGRYAEALAGLESLLAIDGSHYVALELKARLVQAQDRRREADDLLGEARRALTRRDVSRALDQCGRVLALVPDHPEALKLHDEIEARRRESMQVAGLLAQGRAAFKMLRPDDLPDRILHFVEQALATEPGNEEVQELRQRALDHGARAAQLRAHLEAGRSALRDGRYAEAIEAFDQALTVDRAHETAKRLRDEAEAAQRRFDTAEDFFRQGRAHLQVGSLEQAVTAFQQALAAGPRDEQRVLSELSVARQTLKRRAEADLKVELAGAYIRDDNFSAAADLLQSVMADYPEHPEAADRLQEALAVQHRGAQAGELVSRARQVLESSPTEALALLDQALEKQPDDREIQVLRQQAHALQEKQERASNLLQECRRGIEECQYDASEQALRQLAMLVPGHPEAIALGQIVDLLRRGETAQTAKDYSKALDLYGQAQKLWPDSRRIALLSSQTRDEAGLVQRLTQTRARVEDHELESAAAEIQQILAFDSQYTEARELANRLLDLLLGQARNLQATGEYPAAQAACDLALRLNPKSEMAASVKSSLVAEIATRTSSKVTAAEAALDRNDLTVARQDITHGLRIQPDHERLLVLRDRLESRERARQEADVLVARGREALRAEAYDKARQRFEEAARADPRQIEAPKWQQFTRWFVRGRELSSAEMYGSAADLFGQAMGLFSGESDPLPEVAEAHRWQQDAQAREDMLARMAQLLADARRLKGERNYGEARQALVELLKIRFPGEPQQQNQQIEET